MMAVIVMMVDLFVNISSTVMPSVFKMFFMPATMMAIPLFVMPVCVPMRSIISSVPIVGKRYARS